MTKHRAGRPILSLVLAASLVACQAAQVSEEAQARAEWNRQECIKAGEDATEFCQGQYDSEIASAKAIASASDAPDDGPSGLWWKIPLVIVAVPVLLLAYAYANKGTTGFADGGRYKGYKTYDSTFRSAYGTTRCRTQIGGGKSFTDCY